VNLTPAALVAHAKSDAGRRAIRYSATSLICVVITQVLLFLFLTVVHLKPIEANFLAVSLTTIPAFILNKRWVWGKRGKAHMRREVIPFSIFTLAGWILSTVSVAVIDVMTRTEVAASPGTYHHNKLAVAIANIAGFGVLWVLKYLFLDKVMFGEHHHTPYDEDIELEEAAAEPGGPERTPQPQP